MSAVDVDRFIADGFVKLEAAAPPETADAARTLLWQQIGLPPQDPTAWKNPVVWASDLTGAGPLGEIIRSERLSAALDALCAPGGWTPRGALGMIPIRFPRRPPADDRGWHIDAHAPQPDGTYLCSGTPQTMLLLTLLSDIGPDDAPTRIRVGSHRDTAKVMANRLLDPFEAGPLVAAASSHRPLTHATGHPGDMYLLHPFTVHAADEHHGTEPRFMSQTPIPLTSPLTPQGDNALSRAIADPT